MLANWHFVINFAFFSFVVFLSGMGQDLPTFRRGFIGASVMVWSGRSSKQHSTFLGWRKTRKSVKLKNCDKVSFNRDLKPSKLKLFPINLFTEQNSPCLLIWKHFQTYSPIMKMECNFRFRNSMLKSNCRSYSHHWKITLHIVIDRSQQEMDIKPRLLQTKHC